MEAELSVCLGWALSTEQPRLVSSRRWRHAQFQVDKGGVGEKGFNNLKNALRITPTGEVGIGELDVKYMDFGSDADPLPAELYVSGDIWVTGKLEGNIMHNRYYII